MLRQVFIFKDGEKIYQQNFGKALDEESLKSAIQNIEKDAFKTAGEKVEFYDFYKYRISFITEPSKNLLFMFVSDLSDKFEDIKVELRKCKKEFLDMFEGVLDHRFDSKTFEVFEPVTESIHKNMRPKISLLGFSGVGKTTISRLIRAEEIPSEHIPTINGDVVTIKIGKLFFHLWDFAGQEQYSLLWNKFTRGSDAVLLVTDSTLENVEKSRYFKELIQKEAPYAHQAVIANKQDLPDALPVSDIERLLGLKTYSMVATDPNNRDKMITIIADILEMSAEISPLLAPLIERDNKVEEAEKALEAGDFLSAAKIFEDVGDLCLKLGDDGLSREFYEKADKIRKILNSISAQGAQPVGQDTSAQNVSTNADAPGNQETSAPNPIETSPTNQTEQNTSSAPEKSTSIELEQPPTANIPSPSNNPSAATAKKPLIQKPKVAPLGTSNIPPPPQVSNQSATQTTNNPGTAPTPKPAQNKLNSKVSSNLAQLNRMLKGLGSNIPSVKPKINVPKPKQEAPLSSKPVYPKSESSSTPNQNIEKTTPVMPQQNLGMSMDAGAGMDTSMGTVNATGSLEDTKRQLKNQVMELRIKATNISKVLTDLEMQNIMGELSDEEYNKKSERLLKMKEKLEKEIADLEKGIK